MKKAIVLALVLLSACDRAAAPQDSFEVASKGLHSAAIDENGEQLAIGSIWHGASYWRLSDYERLYNWNHKAEELTTVVAMDFSDSGQWLLSAAPHSMVLWNTQTGEGERYWSAPAEILDVELNNRAQLALLGLSDHSAVIFDVRNGGIKRSFAHNNRVRSVDLSANGSLALTGSEDNYARLWQAQSGELLNQIKHSEQVQLVKLSDDGELALSVSKYDKALVWRTKDASLLGEIPLRAERVKRGLHFTAARFSSDNQWLLTGRPDQIVQLWQLQPLKEIKRWRLPKRNVWKPTSAAVIDLAFTSDKQNFVAVASNGIVHKLNLNDTSLF
ncbi:WD40 repeat domain-containing protein [Agaribacterium haliotis]|uniref:WD40 repeat domain-containing protein n=1 Tax=Agaribacterium haliotis TaxID=2013869 RepID=UPI000BB59AB5|nr:hypothetical protein [Agaribacterium haliotis]